MVWIFEEKNATSTKKKKVFIQFVFTYPFHHAKLRVLLHGVTANSLYLSFSPCKATSLTTWCHCKQSLLILFTMQSYKSYYMVSPQTVFNYPFTMQSLTYVILILVYTLLHFACFRDKNTESLPLPPPPNLKFIVLTQVSSSVLFPGYHWLVQCDPLHEIQSSHGGIPSWPNWRRGWLQFCFLWVFFGVNLQPFCSPGSPWTSGAYSHKQYVKSRALVNSFCKTLVAYIQFWLFDCFLFFLRYCTFILVETSLSRDIVPSAGHWIRVLGLV